MVTPVPREVFLYAAIYTKISFGEAPKLRAGLAIAREGACASLESAIAIIFIAGPSMCATRTCGRPSASRHQRSSGAGSISVISNSPDLAQPAMKDFQEKITLEIDENGFGVFIAAFGATAPQCLFRRTNINKRGQSFAARKLSIARTSSRESPEKFPAPISSY